MKAILLSILLFLLQFSELSAQENSLRFEKFTIEDGLTQSTIRCILQDKKGFLWFGTQDGLNRYDGYQFEQFHFDPNKLNSLSNNFIHALYEDHDGIIWIATRSGGLNRFDPSSQKFSNYQHKDSNPNTIASNHIATVFEDAKHNLWIGTSQGLSFFQKNTKSFVNYNFSFPDSTDKEIRAMAQTDSESIWLATSNGLIQFDINKRKVIAIVNTFQNQEGQEISFSAYSLLSDDEILWLGTDRGLITFDSFKNETELIWQPENQNLPITSIAKEKRSNLWLATAGEGTFCYELGNKQVKQFKHIDENDKTLADDYVFDVFIDHSGIIWLGTYNGVSKHDPSFQIFQTISQHYSDANSLSENNVRGITTSKDSLLWIATRGGGINIYKDSKHIASLSKNKWSTTSISDSRVEGIYIDKEGTVWAGTQSGLSKINYQIDKDGNIDFLVKNYRTPSNINNYNSANHIHEIYEDSKGRMWLGSTHGLLKFDKTKEQFSIYQDNNNDIKGLKGNYVRAILEDKKGYLWVGTSEGLNRLYFGESGLLTPVFEHFVHENWNENSLSYNYVRTLYEDKSGNIWIGTAGGGLNRLSIKESNGNETFTFKRYSQKDGLPNNSIYGVLSDKNDNLWISTNRELSCFDTKTEKFKNYGIKDGLQNNEFNQGAYHQDTRGNLYFGGLNGLSYFHPDDIKENAYIPPIVITGFKLFNQNLRPDDKLNRAKPYLVKDISETREVHLKHNENVISFEFAALNFRHPEHNQYAYKLENFDADWNEIGSKRVATYTNLPAGKYTLKIRASNNDHVWNNEGTSLDLIVEPPFWEQLWFRTLGLMLLFGGAFISHRLRTKRIKEENYKLEKLVDQRTKELLQEKHKVEDGKKVLELKNDEIELQKKELELSHKKITDSIRYAETIQQSVLPDTKLLEQVLQDYFLIYQPKDIVSGDFYWVSKTKNHDTTIKIIAVIDCTGHGVPGGFMSMVGHALLHEIIIEKKITDLVRIMELLNYGIIKALKQKELGNTDGMDICMVSIEKTPQQEHKISFCGAKRPLYYYDQKTQQLNTLKGSRKSIGGRQTQNKKYEAENISLPEGGILYLSTDGIVDQHNKEKERLGSYTLINSLEKIGNLPLTDQKVAIQTLLNEHQKDVEQRDDITLLVVKI
ncbi:MAG: hypothetical protein CMO01_29300 [Thalassobius sp.]|nr:hypothetical protein [Thalassovita sp.]